MKVSSGMGIVSAIYSHSIGTSMTLYMEGVSTIDGLPFTTLGVVRGSTEQSAGNSGTRHLCYATAAPPKLLAGGG